MPKLIEKILDQTLSTFGIQGKPAEFLRKELESNLLDHQDKLISEGMSAQKAEQQAVKKFGDPTLIGIICRLQTLTSKNLQQTKIFTNIIGVLCISTGSYYLLAVKLASINLWGFTAIIAGLCSFMASQTISKSKFWQNSAISGFLLLNIGQIPPIIMGFDSLDRVATYGQSTPILYARISEIFIGMGIHTILFVLCIWTIYLIMRLKWTQVMKNSFSIQ